MGKAVDHFKDQLIGIHYGIPTPGLIDTVKVDYHGQPTPIKFLAHTQAGDGRIKVEAYDPTSLSSIEKALVAAGFNAYVFSKTAVAITLPKMATESERDKVITQIRKLEEEAKIAIRNIRKKARQKTKLPEEEQRKEDKALQEETDHHIALIESIATAKVKSLKR